MQHLTILVLALSLTSFRISGLQYQTWQVVVIRKQARENLTDIPLQTLDQGVQRKFLLSNQSVVTHWMLRIDFLMITSTSTRHMVQSETKINLLSLTWNQSWINQDLTLLASPRLSHFKNMESIHRIKMPQTLLNIKFRNPRRRLLRYRLFLNPKKLTHASLLLLHQKLLLPQ